MSAVRMDGKMVSAKVRGSILEEVNGLKEKGVRPGLAVIIVGEDPASKVYVRNKERACESAVSIRKSMLCRKKPRRRSCSV